MMMLLYSALLTLGLILSAPWWLFRMATTERYREGLRQRLGFVPAALKAAIAGKRVVWLHAVSVGEVLAATRLVAELEAALGEGWAVAVSTTTRTGQALAQQRFGAERVFYMPFDFAFAVRAYLRALKPAALILMESELWPRLLHECSRRNIPVAEANARVSDRSFRRAMRVRALWKHLVRKPTLWLAQSEEDARRLMALGARPETIQTSGNLKYDIQPKTTIMIGALSPLLSRRALVVAGSLLEPEENKLLDRWWTIRSKSPEAVLLLAPRHPDRFADVAKIAQHPGFSVYRASELLAQSESKQPLQRLRPLCIIILDTIGDLAGMYALANVAFVGGSLVPRGGHNPLEPARFGIPVIMGSSFENFRDIVTKMQAADAIRIVDDEDQLEATLIHLLTQPAEAKALGQRGRAVFESQQGATARTVTAILSMIESGMDPGAPRLASETWVSTEADGSAQ
jgi:3-deoxy-D-manno-octulosonic-acid transferase